MRHCRCFLTTVVANVSEGTHWVNYYTDARLILKCSGPSPSPPGCRVRVFCLRKPSQGEQWAPRICPEGARSTLLLSGITASRPWEIIKGKGALPKEDLKEQFPRSVLVPRNEWVLCSTALILTIQSESKTFSPFLFLLFVCMFPFSSPISSLHPASPFSRNHNWHTNGRKWEEKHSHSLYWDTTVTTTLDITEKIRIQFKPCLQITTPSYYSLLKERFGITRTIVKISML